MGWEYWPVPPSVHSSFISLKSHLSFVWQEVTTHWNHIEVAQENEAQNHWDVSIEMISEWEGRKTSSLCKVQLLRRGGGTDSGLEPQWGSPRGKGNDQQK